MGLAIYTPGVTDIIKEFQILETLATLPLTLYVIGYGVGPLCFSPITEHYSIGRTSVYIITLFIFTALQIPIALSENITSLSILRLLSGVFASPALATGAASVCDIILVPYMPVVFGIWAVCSLCGPSLGPLIGSLFVYYYGWRWTFLFMLILSSCSLLIFCFFLPETYPPTLMYRRLKRIERLTGEKLDYDCIFGISKKKSIYEIIIEYIWRPIEITLSEPAVFFINLYLALVYSVLYLWFEAFPLVFEKIYHFNLVQEGACFSSILIGIIIGSAAYSTYIYFFFTQKFHRDEEVTPEVFLPMAIVGAIFLPCGLFIFGWCSTANVHWVVCLFGAVLAGFANFLIFQTLLNYLGMSFPRYSASVFASNCLFRSVIAGVFPLFGKALYNNLSSSNYPVGWGSSILGFIAAVMVLLPIIFYINGPALRARSKYSL